MNSYRRTIQQRLRSSANYSLNSRNERVHRVRVTGAVIDNNDDISDESVASANLSDTDSMASSTSDDSTETMTETDSEPSSPILSGRHRLRRDANNTSRVPNVVDLENTGSELSEDAIEYNSERSQNNSEHSRDASEYSIGMSDDNTYMGDQASIQSSDSELTIISPVSDHTAIEVLSDNVYSTDSEMTEPNIDEQLIWNERNPTPMPVPDDDQQSPILSENNLDQNEVVRTSSSNLSPRQNSKSNCKLSQSMNDDDGMTCPICFELWSNSGDHRMASLKCGHIFGKNCIERWLGTASKCPSCNTKGTKKDIRIIFARNLKAIDTCEKDRLAEELKKFKSKVDILEREKARILIKSELDAQQIRKFQEELRMLKNSLGGDAYVSMYQSESIGNLPSHKYKLALQTKFELTKDGATRVMAFNDWMSMLVVSVPTQLAMFPGFGIRKINVLDMRLDKYVALHSKAIRDLAFNPGRQDLLLSVSLDKTAKILNVSNNTVIHTYSALQPLWCCCWNTDNTSEFFVGSSTGVIYAYRTAISSRCTESTATFTVKGSGPIVSICYIAHAETDGFQSGLLIMKLNSVIFLEFCFGEEPKEHELSLEGPFVHAVFDPISRHILITCRPGQRNAHARHIICRLFVATVSEDGTTKVVSAVEVQTLQGGTTMRVLSRACLAPNPNNKLMTLAIFSEENSQTSKIYDMTSAKLIQRLKTNNNIIDCLIVKNPDTNYLALLSERCVTFYKWMNLQYC